MSPPRCYWFSTCCQAASSRSSLAGTVLLPQSASRDNIAARNIALPRETGIEDMVICAPALSWGAEMMGLQVSIFNGIAGQCGKGHVTWTPEVPKIPDPFGYNPRDFLPVS